MRKLVVTCECGERMKVPRSSIGKKGLCPSCGRKIAITAENTENAETTAASNLWRTADGPSWGAEEPSESVKRRYARAVDFYFAKRYADAIPVLEEAVAMSVGDPDAGVIRYHLARAYAANLQHRKARETIRRTLAELESGTDGAGQPEPEWATRMRELERTLGRKIAVPWSKKRGRGRRR